MWLDCLFIEAKIYKRKLSQDKNLNNFLLHNMDMEPSKMTNL